MADQQPVASGRRDKYVQLEQGEKGTGRSTRPVVSWSLLTNVWAHKDDTGGTERFRASALDATIDATFTIPYLSTMDPELVDVPATRRIVYEGRIFDILYARQVGRRRGIELATKAGSRIDA